MIPNAIFILVGQSTLVSGPCPVAAITVLVNKANLALDWKLGIGAIDDLSELTMEE